MIAVSVNEQNELIITGDVREGEKIPNRCCQGFDWVVTDIYPDATPEYTSVWGRCGNPECPEYQESIGPKDVFRGVSRESVEDLAEWIIEHANTNQARP